MRKKKVVSMSLATTVALTAAITPVHAAPDSKVTEKVHKNEESKVPDFISGKLTVPSKKTPREIVFGFLAQKQGLYKFGNDPFTSFKVLDESKDELGYTNLRLQQIYKSVPVFGAVLTAHIDIDGILTAVSGEVAPDLDKKQSLKTGLKIKRADAVAIAVNDLTVKLGEAPELEHEANPEFVVYTKDGQAKFAYAFEFEFLYPTPGNYQYFVDAYTGEVLDSYNQMHGAKPGDGGTSITGTDTVGTGKGVLGDTKSFNTLTNSNGSYLVDRKRGSGIFTYDAKTRTRIPGTLWLDLDNVYNASNDAAAVDAHYYAAQTYDYFNDVFNRDSYDNNGAQLVSTVHYGRNYNNAGWTGSQMIYGDGDGSTFIAFSGALDVIAHELTHAVTDTTADLVYQNESGAINESMSDIFGTLVEHHFNNSPDWLVGEDIYTPNQAGDALRSMEDPTLSGDPDHYSKRYVGTQDNGGVHWNSGIGNKAAYLLANGGTHYGISVSGIGNDKTGDIFYRTLTQYLTPNSNYSQYRVASVQAATDLYGASSSEVASVKAAFNAVGVNY